MSTRKGKAANADNLSVYQILNSNFTFVIVLQTLITALAFFIKWVEGLKIIVFFIPAFLCIILNSFLCSIFLFISIFIILLTPTILINLFTLSQVNNLFFTIKKIAEEKNNNKGNDTKT